MSVTAMAVAADDLPVSIEAEQAILGSLLIDSSAWERIGALNAADFSRADHAAIFVAAQMGYVAGDAADSRGGVTLISRC